MDTNYGELFDEFKQNYTDKKDDKGESVKTFVTENDGKILDATALAAYHYLLKKGIIDNLKTQIPHIIMLTPESYTLKQGGSITIKGITNFPKDSAYKYKIYIKASNYYVDYITIPSDKIDSNGNISVDLLSTTDILTRDIDFTVLLLVQDSNSSTIGVSNIGTIKKLLPLKGGIYSSNCAVTSTEPDMFNACKELNPNDTKDTYVGTYIINNILGYTTPKTMYLYIPKNLNPPEYIYLSNGGVFGPRTDMKVKDATNPPRDFYYGYKYSVDIKDTISFEPVTIS